jgi:hypothetical protein
MDDRVREILRALTPEQKLRTAARMYWAARELRAAGLRTRHPGWTEKQVQEEVRRAFMYARD